MSRVKKLRETIRKLMEGKFSGYIRINFTQGSLGRVEQSEELDAIINHSEERKGRNRNDGKGPRYDNVIDIGNGTDAKGRFGHDHRPGQDPRSGHDRRSGDNDYTGHERRSGHDRRTVADRRNCAGQPASGVERLKKKAK